MPNTFVYFRLKHLILSICFCFMGAKLVKWLTMSTIFGGVFLIIFTQRHPSSLQMRDEPHRPTHRNHQHVPEPQLKIAEYK